MSWRIIVALSALVPAIALALRDGRLTEAEQRELAALLFGELLGLVLPPEKFESLSKHSRPPT